MFNSLLCFSFVYLGIVSATSLNFNTTAGANAGKKLLRSTQFDFVIVGGGTAGLALARRLTDNSRTQVLVLEAGGSGNDNPIVTIPGNSFSFIFTPIDWEYSSAPQIHSVNRSINLSQGKCLGGDSCVNGMAWTYPHRADWDKFEALGNPGWNWDSMSAAVRKAENVDVPAPEFAKEFGYSVNLASHGRGGPIHTGFAPYVPPSVKPLIPAALELGNSFNPDGYNGDPTGVHWTVTSQNNSNVRVTSESGYLDPVINRKNLIVCSFAFVTGLNVEHGKNGLVQSTGVNVRFPDGSTSAANVNSKGEVILSAGTMRTPQLLELAGIGNPEILKKHNIPVMVDLPGVGENYEDHPLTILAYKLAPGIQSFDDFSFNQTFLEEQTELYDTKGQGALSYTTIVADYEPAQQFLNKSEIDFALSLFDDLPASLPKKMADLTKAGLLNRVPQMEFILFNSNSAGPKEPNTSYVSMAVTYLQPLSRGSIHINSTSMDDHPIIDPNGLQVELDLYMLAKGTQFGRKYFETKAYQGIVVEETFPGLQVQTFEDWKNFTTNNVDYDYHSVGSSSMLPRELNGVVDPNLRIYGTSNMRVVDNSIMPMLVSAHTQTTAYAIAERAAEIITSGY